MNAYVVSHNGLGDNLYMIGALRYLLQFYNNVFIVCKIKNYNNFKLFLMDNENIHCIPIDDREERKNMLQVLNVASRNRMNDLFVCGSLKHSFHTRISNQKLIDAIILEKSKPRSNEYKIDYDMLNSQNYGFIESLYKDINMDLSIFYNYYKIPETQESIQLYEKIKNYYIVFIQLKSSCGKSLNISNIIKKYINDKNSIMICNDTNLYRNYYLNNNNNLNEDELNHISNKMELCEYFNYNKLINYYTTIINSNEIYIIDSCFVGIVLPLLKQNKLKATTIRIILRDSASQIVL